MYSRTLVQDGPAPAEALIPEAREHQQRRYRRSAVLVSLVALLVGGLVALLIAATSGGSAPSHTPAKPLAAAAGRGPVLVRPVLCDAPPYAPSAAEATAPRPACADPYLLSAANLDVTPRNAPRGYVTRTVGPDPALAAYPSTTADATKDTVLLPGLTGTGAARFLLGPAAMRLSASTVRTARVEQLPAGSGNWVVNLTFSPAAAAQWDTVAYQSFHQVLAIDVGGQVVSAPIVEPARSSFTSFDGAMEISGALKASAARAVAAAVTSTR